MKHLFCFVVLFATFWSGDTIAASKTIALAPSLGGGRKQKRLSEFSSTSKPSSEMERLGISLGALYCESKIPRDEIEFFAKGVVQSNRKDCFDYCIDKQKMLDFSMWGEVALDVVAVVVETHPGVPLVETIKRGFKEAWKVYAYKMIILCNPEDKSLEEGNANVWLYVVVRETTGKLIIYAVDLKEISDGQSWLPLKKEINLTDCNGTTSPLKLDATIVGELREELSIDFEFRMILQKASNTEVVEEEDSFPAMRETQIPEETNELSTEFVLLEPTANETASDNEDEKGDFYAICEALFESMRYDDDMIERIIVEMGNGFASELSEKDRALFLGEFWPVYLQWAKKYMSFDAFRPFFVKWYSDNFTISDIQQMTVFYQSEVGQKMVRLTPNLSKSLGRAFMTIFEQHSGELIEQLQKSKHQFR